MAVDGSLGSQSAHRPDNPRRSNPGRQSSKNISIDSMKSGSCSVRLIVQCTSTPSDSAVTVKTSAFGQPGRVKRTPSPIRSRRTWNWP
jgi:hypothetical protein